MKNLQGCLVYFVGGVILAVAITGAVYVHEMSPTWADIAQKEAQHNLKMSEANTQTDIAAHTLMSMAWSFGSWVLVFLVGGVVGIKYAYVPWHERQESQRRMVDGSYPLQREESTNGRIVYLDPNKPAFGALGFDKMAGTVLTDAEMIGPDRQLEYANNVQRTRTVAAKQLPERPNRTTALVDAGVFEAKRREADARAKLAEQRLLTQTPAHDDGEAITEPIELLTLKQAVERSTPEAWIIGQNQETGKLAYFKPNEAIHLAILGATGTGKTSSTGMQIVGYALKNGWRVSILDGKGRGDDWSKFSRWCEHAWIDSENFADALMPIKAEYDRRSELLRFENPPKLQPLLVMIEEYGDINEGLMGKAKETVNSILDTLVRKARDTEIHLCFIDQYPEKWEKQLLNNTKNKVVYWLNDGTLVKEHFVHQLALNGEFYLKGERYNSWHVKPMVKSFLSDVPVIEAKPFTPSFNKPFTESFNRSITPVDPPPSEQSERVNADAPTDLEALVWQWRDEHPQGTQAELRRDFERRQIEISKGHVFNCWHKWTELHEDK